MRFSIKLLLLSMIFLFSSCWVKNLNSAFEAKDITFDEKLIGTWTLYTTDSIPELEEKLIISRASEDKYNVTMIYISSKSNFTNDSGNVENKTVRDTMMLGARLGKIGSNKYFEMFLTDSKTKLINKEIIFITTNYFLYKLNILNNSLSLSTMDSKRFKALAMATKLAYFQRDDDESILITAKTKQIKSFLKKHENDNELFHEEKIYKRE